MNKYIKFTGNFEDLYKMGFEYHLLNVKVEYPTYDYTRKNRIAFYKKYNLDIHKNRFVSSRDLGYGHHLYPGTFTKCLISIFDKIKNGEFLDWQSDYAPSTRNGSFSNRYTICCDQLGNFVGVGWKPISTRAVNITGFVHFDEEIFLTLKQLIDQDMIEVCEDEEAIKKINKMLQRGVVKIPTKTLWG